MLNKPVAGSRQSENISGQWGNTWSFVWMRQIFFCDVIHVYLNWARCRDTLAHSFVFCRNAWITEDISVNFYSAVYCWRLATWYTLQRSTVEIFSPWSDVASWKNVFSQEAPAACLVCLSVAPFPWLLKSTSWHNLQKHMELILLAFADTSTLFCPFLIKWDVLF